MAFVVTAITLLASPSGAFGFTFFGVDAANNLVRFEGGAPGTIISTQPVLGLAAGETILGIDFRTKDGTLFALGSTSRLYRIDYTSTLANATATAIGNAGAFTLSGTSFGFDINPVVDRFRIVSDTDQNIRVNPNDGSLAGTDTPLAYAAGDPNNGQNPNVVGAGYNFNLNNGATTTLYGIDSNLDVLVRQGGFLVPPGTPSPNSGQLFTVGSLGIDVGSNVGFDIDFTDIVDSPYLAATVGGLERLYFLNINTGAATLIGTIGTGTPLKGVAVAPTSFSATLAGTTVTFTGNTAQNSIVFDQSGGLLRHNRFTAGDSRFNSDFDFDPMTPGDQTLSATNPAVTVIVNADASDDRVTIGSASAPASSLAATFQINGQGGGDSLVINDSADSTARIVLIDGFNSTITGLGGPISYGTLENVTVNAGSGGDTINVQGTSAALTSINTGDGADTVVFGNGATLSGGFIDGGPGTDTLDYSSYNTQVIVDLSPTGAQTLFLGLMTGDQESGPLSNSPATGQLVGTLNAAQTAFTFHVSYQGLTGAPISGAHFHNQNTGVAGPIVRGLMDSEKNGFVTPSGTFMGIWSNSDPTLDPPASDAPIRP